MHESVLYSESPGLEEAGELDSGHIDEGGFYDTAARVCGSRGAAVSDLAYGTSALVDGAFDGLFFDERLADDLGPGDGHIFDGPAAHRPSLKRPISEGIVDMPNATIRESKPRVSFGDSFFEPASSSHSPDNMPNATAGESKPRVSFGDSFFEPTSSSHSPERSVLVKREEENEDLDVFPIPTRSSPPVSPLFSWEHLDNRFRSSEGRNLLQRFGQASHEGPGEIVRLSREMLSRASVVSQMDSKFILLRHEDAVVVVDQHAADERVQLERLEREHYAHPRSCNLPTAEVVRLDGPEMASLVSYTLALTEYGFRFSASSISNEVEIFASPEVYGTCLTGVDFVHILNELREFDPSAAGFKFKPSIIQYILCSKACRTAVMFGDLLHLEQCEGIMRDLAACELPFQCAHGRPSSTVVATRVSAFRGTSSKPKMRLRFSRLSGHA